MMNALERMVDEVRSTALDAGYFAAHRALAEEPDSVRAIWVSEAKRRGIE